MLKITHTIKCDRCGQSGAYLENGEKPFKINTIRLAIVETGRYSYTLKDDAGRIADWCEDCCIRTGLMRPTKHTVNPPPPSVPEPTLEDMVRDIVRDELSSQ